MVLQTVSRGTCAVVGSGGELGTTGALENSSVIIALSDGGMAFWHVAGSNPEDDDNPVGMSGDFERFAVTANFFYVVFGSYAKNAPTYTTASLEGYLNDLNEGAEILWYKDGCYSRVAVNSQGEITLSVPLDGMGASFSGGTSNTYGTKEPVMLSTYLSASSHVQKAAAFPSYASGGEQPQSLFAMLGEGKDTAPAETSLVVLDRDQTTINDMQNLRDILLLKSFISVEAMSLMYKRRDNKPYNLDDKVEAAQFVIDQTNALNEVTSKSMGGFLNPKQATAYSYEKDIFSVEVHSEILDFLFGSFSLPEKAVSQIDGLLTTANTTLSLNIENQHTTLNHMIYVFTFEPVEGLATVKLPVLRQLYLKIDQKSWKAALQVGKLFSSEVNKFNFKMNVVDTMWEMNPGQVDIQRTEIEELLTNMTSANLDQIHELASPSVIDAGSPTSAASFQITNGELRFHQQPAMMMVTEAGQSTWTNVVDGVRLLNNLRSPLITYHDGALGRPPDIRHDTNQTNVRYLLDLGRKVVRTVRQLLKYGTLNNTMYGGPVKSKKPGANTAFGYINVAKRGQLNQIVEEMVVQLTNDLPVAYTSQNKKDVAHMMAICTATRHVQAGVCAHIAHLTLGVMSTMATNVTACIVRHSADHFFVIVSRPGTRWYVIDPWVGQSYVCPTDSCHFSYTGIRAHWKIDIHEACSVPYGISFSSRDIDEAYDIAEEKSGVAPEFNSKVWAHHTNLKKELDGKNFFLAAQPLEWGKPVKIFDY